MDPGRETMVKLLTEQMEALVASLPRGGTDLIKAGFRTGLVQDIRKGRLPNMATAFRLQQAYPDFINVGKVIDEAVRLHPGVDTP